MSNHFKSADILVAIAHGKHMGHWARTAVLTPNVNSADNLVGCVRVRDYLVSKGTI